MELWTCVCLISKPVSIPSPPCSYVSDVTPSSQTNRHLVLGPLLFPAPCVSLDFLPFFASIIYKTLPTSIIEKPT